MPRLVLAALLTAAGLVLLTPASAHACSCVGGDVAAYADRADVVFTGTLVEVTPPPERLFWSSGDPATYSFDVDRVHQGEVGPSTEVRSAVSGASCGLEGMQTGSRYVVFATLDDGLWANLCGGTDPCGRASSADSSTPSGRPGRRRRDPSGGRGRVGRLRRVRRSTRLAWARPTGVGGPLKPPSHAVAVASLAVRSRVSSSGSGSALSRCSVPVPLELLAARGRDALALAALEVVVPPGPRR